MYFKKYLHVYILKCSDGIYYTGITNDPERRLKEHNSGVNERSYTYSRRPVEMVYCERFSDFNLAIKLPPSEKVDFLNYWL